MEYANAQPWPRPARFEWFVCAGASRRLLHVWIQLAHGAARSSSLYHPHALLRQPAHVERVQQLLRYLVEFDFALLERLMYVPGHHASAVGRWTLRATESQRASPERAASRDTSAPLAEAIPLGTPV